MMLLALEVLMAAAALGAFFTLRKFDPSMVLDAPQWLPLLYATPLLSVIFLFNLAWRNRALKRLADAELLSVVTPRISQWRVVLRFVLWRVALMLVVIGLLGPKVGSRLEEVETRGIDLMIALDVSNSMLAEDLKPNRMDHSKRVIQRLIKELAGNRIGIVIFAGDAYVQLPLTSDVQSARIFLDAINPGIVPTQGTAIGAAIDLCIESFDPGSEAGRMILLITDGENHEDDAVDAARRAAEQSIKVCSIGAGVPGGAPIPRYNERGQRIGFRTDRSGNTIVTALDEALLVDIVKAGNGVFVRSNPGGINLSPITDAMNDLDKGEMGSASFTDHRHLYHPFIVAALALLLMRALIGEKRWKTSIRIS